MLTQRLTLAAALLSGVAIISAQDLNALPACARDPVSAAVTSSGCPATDTDCVCSSTAFLNAIAVTIPAACSAEEIALVIASGKLLCPNLAGGSGGGGGGASTTHPTDGNPPASTPTASNGDGTASPPVQSDGHSAAPTTEGETTVVPGTVTSTKSVPDSSSTTTVPSESISTIPSSSTSHSTTTTTTTPETTASETLSTSTSTSTYQSTFTGAAANDKIKGVFAMAIGIFGAVAFL